MVLKWKDIISFLKEWDYNDITIQILERNIKKLVIEFIINENKIDKIQYKSNNKIIESFEYDNNLNEIILYLLYVINEQLIRKSLRKIWREKNNQKDDFIMNNDYFQSNDALFDDIKTLENIVN